jgi:dipeptidyl aminopeptidase/acylaminoacyl peptidase
VVFHGFARRKLDDARRLQPLDLADSVVAPSLLLHGTDDKSAPVEGMRELRGRLGGLGRICEMKELAGAQHGFAVSTHPNFSAAHAAPAFDEARRFLAIHLAAV